MRDKKKQKEYNKKYYLEHADSIKKHVTEYYDKNIEKVLEYAKVYRNDNSEKIADYKAEWFQNNKKEIYLKRKQKPQNYSLWRMNRRLKMYGPGVTKDEWESLVHYFESKCAYCSGTFSKLELDHVIPISKGGRHEIGNILPSCRSCNAKKHVKSLDEWYPGYKEAMYE